MRKLSKVEVIQEYFGDVSVDEIRALVRSDRRGYEELVTLACREMRVAIRPSK